MIEDDDPGYDRAHIIEVLCEDAKDEYLAWLRSVGISYIFAGQKEMDLSLALSKLYSLFNIRQYPETDWRSAYVGPVGLVAVYESEHKAAGKKFACFFPDMPDQFTQDWLRTSAGELRVEEETYTITTRNSSYVFVRDEEALPKATDQLYGKLLEKITLNKVL